MTETVVPAFCLLQNDHVSYSFLAYRHREVVNECSGVEAIYCCHLEGEVFIDLNFEIQFLI